MQSDIDIVLTTIANRVSFPPLLIYLVLSIYDNRAITLRNWLRFMKQIAYLFITV